MKSIEDIIAQYEIGEIKSVVMPGFGSNDTWIIESLAGKYVLKRNQREDYVQVQIIANKALGLKRKMNRIIESIEGEFIVDDNYVLYEYIHGEVISNIDDLSISSFLRELALFNIELRDVNINDIKIERHNYWDDAFNTSYISDEYLRDLCIYGFDKDLQKRIVSCTNHVLQKVDLLARKRNQLIHSDLGIDNMILTKHKHVKFIDFTPLVDSHYLSVASFIYWEILYKNDEINYCEVLACFSEYEKSLPNDMIDDVDEKLTYLLKYTLSKLVGATLKVINSSKIIELKQVEYRLVLLESLMNGLKR
ncbi:phosphotransferase [Clostridiaceae bacterium M8S5]|nr:phosphotransferase [Clostridiaceae bacterium M8S5]